MMLAFAIKNYDFSYGIHHKFDTRLFFSFFFRNKIESFFLERNTLNNSSLIFFNQEPNNQNLIKTEKNFMKYIKNENKDLDFYFLQFDNFYDLKLKVGEIITQQLPILNKDYENFFKVKYGNKEKILNDYKNITFKLPDLLNKEFDSMINNLEPYNYILKELFSYNLNKKISQNLNIINKNNYKI